VYSSKKGGKAKKTIEIYDFYATMKVTFYVKEV